MSNSQKLRNKLNSEQEKQLYELEQLLKHVVGEPFQVESAGRKLFVPDCLKLPDPARILVRRWTGGVERIEFYINTREIAVKKEILARGHRTFCEWRDRYDLPETLEVLQSKKYWDRTTYREKAYVMFSPIGVIPTGYVVFLGSGSILLFLERETVSDQNS